MSFRIRRKNLLHIEGFTLIELIIVMALMALLAIVGLTNYQTSLQNGRDNRRKLDLKSVSSALQIYYSDNSAYPTQTSYGSIPGTGVLVPIYLKTMSTDPKFSVIDGYRYKSTASGQCYCLTAKMERDANAKDETNGDTICNPAPYTPSSRSYLLFCP